MKTGLRIYNLFPSLVGSIENWSKQLPRIAAMGFDWVYVNPFHETGYSGSLYAVKDYYRLNPLFRGAATASDDDLLRGFIADATAAGIGVMMDLVVNHTARDCVLAQTHPQWYRRSEDGDIESPSASDPADPSKVTVWTDLAELDYTDRPERAEMVAYFSDVVRHYAQLGMRGFRCDAAYKIPGEIWPAFVAAARDVLPATVFAAETLGAPLEAIAQLRPAGFDYLFNSSKWWDFQAPWLLEQYEQFRHIAPSIAFPESHDTPRLATEFADLGDAQLEAEYRFRYLFAAFFSTGVMMPIGYEYGFDRPFDVVMTRPDHWQTPRFDLTAFIADVNAMKASVPALNEEGAERRFPLANGAVGLLRNALAGSSTAVAVFNPDTAQSASIDAADVLREIESAVDITPAAAAGEPLRADLPIELAPLGVRIFTKAMRAAGNGVAVNGRSQAGPGHAEPADARLGGACGYHRSRIARDQRRPASRQTHCRRPARSPSRYFSRRSRRIKRGAQVSRTRRFDVA